MCPLFRPLLLSLSHVQVSGYKTACWKSVQTPFPHTFILYFIWYSTWNTRFQSPYTRFQSPWLEFTNCFDVCFLKYSSIWENKHIKKIAQKLEDRKHNLLVATVLMCPTHNIAGCMCCVGRRAEHCTVRSKRAYFLYDFSRCFINTPMTRRRRRCSENVGSKSVATLHRGASWSSLHIYGAKIYRKLASPKTASKFSPPQWVKFEFSPTIWVKMPFYQRVLKDLRWCIHHNYWSVDQ